MNAWGAVAGAATLGVVGTAVGRYLHGRWTIDRHVEEYATHWSNRDSRPPEGALHYVALGDSAAQGVGASAVDKGYVPLVAMRMAQATGRPVVITNLSVSGAVSDDVAQGQLANFRSLQFAPDVVTLDIGANDVLFQPHGVESFGSSLEVILDALPKGSFVADVPWMVFPWLSAQSAILAARARELVERHGHHLVPLYRASRANSVFTYARRTSRDLFHPNDAGYLQWADVFWEGIAASGVLEELQSSGAPSED